MNSSQHMLSPIRSLQTAFQCDNTGSNPVGDATDSAIGRNKWSLFKDEGDLHLNAVFRHFAVLIHDHFLVFDPG
jgi:hypothetical protein